MSKIATKKLPQRWTGWLAGGALLVGALLAAYGNHFGNGFHMDDGHAIVDNVALRDLGNVPRFFRDPTTFSALPSNQSYRPLQSTLLAIDYRLGHGLGPFWFQASTFALFCALVFLLAVFVRHPLDRDRGGSAFPSWVALAAAGWYGLNPDNADTVNYVIASSEVMATLGVVASFVCFCEFPQLRRWGIYALPAAVAILAKPTAAIFPVLFAVFVWFFPDEAAPTARRRLVQMVPAFLLCGGVLWFVQHMTPKTWVAGAADARGYLLAQPYVALLYFKTFFWPSGLNADYDLQPFASMADPRLWLGVGFVLILVVAAIVAARRKGTRLVSFGLLWFLLALLPTSLLPLAEVMNDHRAFLSNIGLVLACAGVAQTLWAHIDWSRRWRKTVAASAVVLLLCANAFGTFQRNKVWKTEETLWRDVALKNPRNGRGLMTYGITLVNNGKFAEAVPVLERARELVPPYSPLLINLANAQDATGQTEAAERNYREALRLAPLSPANYVSYARYCLAHERVDQGRALLLRARELAPDDQNIATLLQEAEAFAAAEHTKRGGEQLRRGNFRGAITEYQVALAIAPRFASALNNLAWLRSTCPEPSLRDGAEALGLASQAEQIGGGREPVSMRTLAAAYAENGRFAEAMQTAERASELALEQKNRALAEKLEKDLSLYRENLPLHPVAPKP